MISEFISFAESNNIAIKDGKTLVAVSGGVDSVVLAHVFSKANLNFSIAHCNFNLRGNESDEDEKFVKKLAKSLNCTFYTTFFNTLNVAKTKGISIQMAARDLRYAWFEQIREKHGYNYIATAHHKGDVAETVLYNLSKGTGLDGLHGIKVKSNKLIRPFLFASRAEVELYAKKNAINWREDSSNAIIKYSRNKIRHQVIPLLEELNPKAQNSINTTSNRIKEIETFLHYNVALFKKKIVEKRGNSSFISINQLNKILGFRFLLFELLKPFGFTYEQSGKIAHALKGVSGKLFYSKSHVANIDRDYLVVSTIPQNNNTVFIKDANVAFSFNNKHIATKSIKYHDYTIVASNKILALDKDKLKFPLKIRKWEIGDVFYPLGMKGKKKISDFMIDAKIPVNLKNEVYIIVTEDKIVGILEHRLDDRFKITKDTQQVFEITYS